MFQDYVFCWYHTYLLRPGMDRMETMIFQYLYWPIIINDVRKEVINCDTFQHTKRSNIRYSKLPATEAEEILYNKLCLYIIDPYVMRRQ